MKAITSIVPYVMACVLMTSCQGKQHITVTDEAAMPATAQPTTAVQDSAAAGEPATAISATSSKTVSKGKIASVTDIAVYSQMQEQIVQLNIRDGNKVRKGQVIVVLDDERLMNQLVQARNDFEQAQFQYEEILVGQGYKKTEFGNVPDNVKTLAKVKSGYNTRKTSLEQAERSYAKRQITAPVSGMVTDVAVHLYDLPQSSTPMCRIFDAEHMKVEFSILESERSRIDIGHKVSVTTVAYLNERHEATVTLISPKVDENGMIRIEAEISDSHNLIPGMTAFVNL